MMMVMVMVMSAVKWASSDVGDEASVARLSEAVENAMASLHVLSSWMVDIVRRHQERLAVASAARWHRRQRGKGGGENARVAVVG